ncbi:MAG: dicarboxylate/amino acid:cation symporter, partial [Myxococcales bacterium]|nr:dicarboxylate/amino acid:cation symporter [Myxococcales bacterium]
GVLALVATTVAELGIDLFATLFKYVVTVIVGLLFHGVLTLGTILWVFGGIEPWRYAHQMARALMTAFSTDSSSATLPVTMECVEEAGVSNRVSSFVLPLGATVNMDGTALYEAVAAMFIAQVYGIDLSFVQQVVIFLTATLAAIGAAGVPSAGLVTMIIVLRSVGLPLEGIGILVGIDRVLDMCRTTVNVWGDAVGARIIARSEGELDVSTAKATSLAEE